MFIWIFSPFSNFGNQSLVWKSIGSCFTWILESQEVTAFFAHHSDHCVRGMERTLSTYQVQQTTKHRGSKFLFVSKVYMYILMAFHDKNVDHGWLLCQVSKSINNKACSVDSNCDFRDGALCKQVRKLCLTSLKNG